MTTQSPVPNLPSADPPAKKRAVALSDQPQTKASAEREAPANETTTPVYNLVSDPRDVELTDEFIGTMKERDSWLAGHATGDKPLSAAKLHLLIKEGVIEGTSADEPMLRQIAARLENQEAIKSLEAAQTKLETAQNDPEIAQLKSEIAQLQSKLERKQANIVAAREALKRPQRAERELQHIPNAPGDPGNGLIPVRVVDEHRARQKTIRAMLKTPLNQAESEVSNLEHILVAKGISDGRAAYQHLGKRRDPEGRLLIEWPRHGNTRQIYPVINRTALDASIQDAQKRLPAAKATVETLRREYDEAMAANDEVFAMFAQPDPWEFLRDWMLRDWTPGELENS